LTAEKPACRVIVLHLIKRNKLGMAEENCTQDSNESMGHLSAVMGKSKKHHEVIGLLGIQYPKLMFKWAEHCYMFSMELLQ
jgi:hypothetical protein